jgi:hypothetical protein
MLTGRHENSLRSINGFGSGQDSIRAGKRILLRTSTLLGQTLAELRDDANTLRDVLEAVVHGKQTGASCGQARTLRPPPATIPR